MLLAQLLITKWLSIIIHNKGGDMNYSINYAGFIDLAEQASVTEDRLPSEETENCKPAIAVQLYKDKNIDEFMNGIIIHNPIKRQRN